MFSLYVNLLACIIFFSTNKSLEQGDYLWENIMLSSSKQASKMLILVMEV